MEILTQIFAPVQVLAWGAALLLVISYQKQTANKTIFWWIPADVLMLAHFYFMGAPFFMLLAGGGLLRSIIALKFSHRTLLIYLAFYMFLLGVALLFIGDDFKDYIAFLGTSFFSLSVIFKQKFIWHRMFAFAHQACWIAAFIMLGSFGGLALISFMFISNAIGTTRYLINQRYVP